MKKAFTLVELAIVLVVIGLLLTLSIKGKSLVATAKMKAEVAKVTQIEKAFRNFTERFNFFPGYSNGSTVTSQGLILNHLIGEGYITEKDFEFDNGKAFWRFIPCVSNTERWDLSGADLALLKNGGMCIRLEDNVGNIYKAPGPFICQVEVTLDDSNVKRGKGRQYQPSPSNMLGNPIKCKDVKDDDRISYAYRIY